MHIEIENLDKYRIISAQNCVLVKNLYENKGSITKSGIIMPIDDQFEKASHANRIGEVVKTVPELHFNYGDNTRLSWKTTMELKPGDIIWYSAMSAVNANTVVCKGEKFLLIPYREIKVAKRAYEGQIKNINGELYSVNNRRLILTDSDIYEVIPVNGYVLLEEIKQEVGFLEFKKTKVDLTKGKVCYIGKPNIAYDTLDVDASEGSIVPGDVVIFNNKKKHVLLEDSLHKRFDGDKEFIVMQSRYLIGKIE